MGNAPLLPVSALFFLGMSATLYVLTWLAASAVLQMASHFPARSTKTLLFAALLLPPLIACALTAGGALLNRSHTPGQMHHSVYCADIARFLSAVQGHLPLIAGRALQGIAWLTLLGGLVMVLRLVIGTLSLERSLASNLRPPSPKLATAISHVQKVAHFGALPFFEADIPMACSCLIGIRHVRCVLSKHLVVSSRVEELEAIVAHEASHFRADDAWRTLAVAILNCLFPYVRPVRLLSKRWREATELTCDAAAVTATREPLAMAAAILRVGGVPVSSCQLPTANPGFAAEAACSPAKRVERLLEYARQPEPIRTSPTAGAWQWAATAALVLTGIFLLLSPQTLCFARCSLQAISPPLP